MLAALQRGRYGLLALLMLLWCAAGRHPTQIAAMLFCSRSRVYHTERAYRAGTLGLEAEAVGWVWKCAKLVATHEVPYRVGRRHQRRRLAALGADVEDRVQLNSAWRYKLSDRSYEPSVTDAFPRDAAGNLRHRRRPRVGLL